MSQYYDLNRKVILWKVKGHERIAMRTVVKDAFESARASLVKHVGPEARKWTDLQIITINMAAPAGYHWEVTYEGGARE